MSIFHKILIAIAISALIPAIAFSDQLLTTPTVVIEPEPEIITEEPVVVKEVILTPVEYADKYAKQYKIDASVFKKVMFCESGNKPVPKGHNDGGKAYGIFQFHKPTFYAYAKKLGKDLDYYSYKDQIELAAYMFSIKQYGHWTCYAKVLGK